MAEILNNAEIDALLARISAVLTGQARQEFLEFIGAKLGVKGEQIAGAYPPSPDGRPLAQIYTRTREDGTTYLSKFKSDAQQGKVFALLAEGAIPFVRDGKLGQSITSKVEATLDAVLARVGTNRAGAIYTIGEKQSHYHAETGWLILPDNLKKHVDDLRAVIPPAAQGWLSGYLAGG